MIAIFVMFGKRKPPLVQAVEPLEYLNNIADPIFSASASPCHILENVRFQILGRSRRYCLNKCLCSMFDSHVIH